MLVTMCKDGSPGSIEKGWGQGAFAFPSALMATRLVFFPVDGETNAGLAAVKDMDKKKVAAFKSFNRSLDDMEGLHLEFMTISTI
jgi:hypothetical protein